MPRVQLLVLPETARAGKPALSPARVLGAPRGDSLGEAGGRLVVQSTAPSTEHAGPRLPGAGALITVRSEAGGGSPG